MIAIQKKRIMTKACFKYSDNHSFFKSLSNTIKTIKTMMSGKQITIWKTKRLKRNLTPEELKEAEKEQEVIQKNNKKLLTTRSKSTQKIWKQQQEY